MGMPATHHRPPHTLPQHACDNCNALAGRQPALGFGARTNEAQAAKRAHDLVMGTRFTRRWPASCPCRRAAHNNTANPRTVGEGGCTATRYDNTRTARSEFPTYARAPALEGADLAGLGGAHAHDAGVHCAGDAVVLLGVELGQGVCCRRSGVRPVSLQGNTRATTNAHKQKAERRHENHRQRGCGVWRGGTAWRTYCPGQWRP